MCVYMYMHIASLGQSHARRPRLLAVFSLDPPLAVFAEPYKVLERCEKSMVRARML